MVIRNFDKWIWSELYQVYVILFYRESQGFGGEVRTGETRHQPETERDGNQTNSIRQQECLK